MLHWKVDMGGDNVVQGFTPVWDACIPYLHVWVWVSVPLPIPAFCSCAFWGWGEKGWMVPGVGSMPSMWEMWIESLIPASGLVQPWLLWEFGEWISGGKISVFLIFKQSKNYLEYMCSHSSAWTWEGTQEKPKYALFPSRHHGQSVEVCSVWLAWSTILHNFQAQAPSLWKEDGLL